MQYRTFKKTGEKVSLLGFGAMRLPVKNEKVDDSEVVKMIRNAIDNGVNYVDTAYMYHDGMSEVAVGKALQDGYREKVFLADKMPVWFVKAEDDKQAEEGLQNIFDEQLKRLGVQSIDMYLLHNINVPIWKKVKEMNAIEFLENKKAEGKIKHIGFSFHDNISLFKEVIDAYDWDFCQIQLNYMDTLWQAGLEGLRYAESKGVPVIIMEPLKGGLLTDALPESIKKFWNAAEVKRTPAEWALRFVADFPNVLTILSGMTTMEQVSENLRILSDAPPNSLTEKEHSIIKQVADAYNELIQYPCTGCKYCVPCPQKINIPQIMDFYNNWFLYAQSPKIKESFDMWIAAKPSVCTACKACEEHCPQKLNITKMLKKATEIFE